MVEARDVGHDRLLVRTGSAHNVCGGKGGGQGGEGGRMEDGGGGELSLLIRVQINEDTGSRAGVQLFT